MLPVSALFDFFDKFNSHEFRASGDNALSFDSQVQPFHEIVDPVRSQS